MIRIASALILLLSFTFQIFGQYKEVNPSENRIDFTGKFNQHLEVKNIPPFSGKLNFKPINFIQSNNKSLEVRLIDPNKRSVWIEGVSRKAMQLRNESWKIKSASYLNEVYQIIWGKEDNRDITIVSQSQDEFGVHHIKIQQILNNLPVFDSQCYLHGKTDVSMLNGKILPPPTDYPENIPLISEDQAIKIVRSTDIADLTNFQKNLVINLLSEDKVILGYIYHKNKYRLVYNIAAHTSLIEKNEYIIDANTGEIISSFPLVCKLHNHDLKNTVEFRGPSTANATDLFGKQGMINTFNEGDFFFLIDATRTMFKPNFSTMPNEPVGVIWTIDAFNTSPENQDFKYGHVFSADNTWNGQENAVSAHVNAGKAYEYFKNTHLRESMNGEGGNIISFINIADKTGNSLENAFWNGSAMFYGSGGNSFLPLARGLDVAAHELAHGVIQNTANLNYQGESGAINESMADIFGVMVDRDDWLIGEDVVRTTAFPSGALRNLQDPHNGALINDYGNGFQPKHVSEQYTGSQDNGGVHINSGIPNHAFFLLATTIGKEKAEKIFFRALSTYLLRSSQFIDLRIAVIQSAKDLDVDGDNIEEQAAASAFDQVGIVEAGGGEYQQDLEPNNGNEFLLCTSSDRQELFLYNNAYQPLFLLFDQGIISKPSVTDDGSSAIFVGSDKKIYIVDFNWGNGLPKIGLVNDSPIWRNAVISKDRRKIAALYDDNTNRIFVYDFNLQSGINFDLYNPTFTEGVITDNVDFADAMEFDNTGNFIMYDAQSSFPSDDAAPITAWDIGFIRVWNEEANTWSLGNIQKLFTTLPEGTNVGNPTFSKNSPYIITFDRKNSDGEYFLMGANLETGDLVNITSNSFWNVPNYKVNDQEIVFEFLNNATYDLLTLEVDDSKISYVDQSIKRVLDNRRWGIWFANGERNLNTSAPSLKKLTLMSVYPNPTEDLLTLQLDYDRLNESYLEIFGINGKRMYFKKVDLISGKNKISVDVSAYPSGTYMLTLKTGSELGSQLFNKN